MTTTHCHAAICHAATSCAYLAEQRAREPLGQQHGKQLRSVSYGFPELHRVAIAVVL
jgi:hypothetical protein